MYYTELVQCQLYIIFQGVSRISQCYCIFFFVVVEKKKARCLKFIEFLLTAAGDWTLFRWLSLKQAVGECLRSETPEAAV